MVPSLQFFLINSLHVFFIRATSPDWIILVITHEESKMWSFSLCDSLATLEDPSIYKEKISDRNWILLQTCISMNTHTFRFWATIKLKRGLQFCTVPGLWANKTQNFHPTFIPTEHTAMWRRENWVTCIYTSNVPWGFIYTNIPLSIQSDILPHNCNYRKQTNVNNAMKQSPYSDAESCSARWKNLPVYITQRFINTYKKPRYWIQSTPSYIASIIHILLLHFHLHLEQIFLLLLLIYFWRL